MIHRYGGRKFPKIATFETLKSEGEIFEYKALPKVSTKIYVSHEWLSRNHADPKGIHTRNLVRILTSLGKDKFEVSMDPFHTLIYGESRTTTKAEWKKMSPESTYIWFDWCCVPAHRREDAMRSIHAFIRRSNFVLTLVPGAKHEDRIDPSTSKEQLEIMQRLVKQGADMRTSFTNSGASVLHELCRNQDATAEVCRWILSVEPDLRSMKRSPQTLKWKLKLSITKILFTVLGLHDLHDVPSETALDEAIRQGNGPILDVLRGGVSLFEEEVDL